MFHGIIVPSLREDNLVPLGNKFVGDINGLGQKSAGISPQIENEALHPLDFQAVYGRLQILTRTPGKTGQTDISGSRFDHKSRWYTLDLDLIADDGYIQRRHFVFNWK